MSDGLAVENIKRVFGTQHAVDGVSFNVDRGELVALVGASGSGKTTTLRMVAGYEMPDAGQISFDGIDITRLPPSRRGFGMVFQHYALFPHMSVADNVAFGLEARGVSRKERRERAMKALDRVGLGAKGSRMVQQLSGGEQQRVALARATVINPRMLLLDEPLSNLDPTLRQSTRDELRSTLKETSAPALFVTHDQDDAFAIADRIVLVANGRVLQIGTPEDLYARPASRDVASFIGHAALVPGTLQGDVAIVRVGERTIRVPVASTAGLSDGDTGVVVVRPEAVAPATNAAANAADGWTGSVKSRRFAGAAFVYTIALGMIEIEVTSTDRFESGDSITLSFVRPVPMVR